jgi:hypothetical protein
MSQRLGGAAALVLALLMSSAAAAQTRNDIGASAFAWYPLRIPTKSPGHSEMMLPGVPT